MARRWMVGGIAAGVIAAAVGIGGGVLPSLAQPGDEAGAFESLSPVRILDTRTATGAPLARLNPGQQLDVQVTGVGGIPTNAVAVVLNVTIDSPSADTFITVWPAGEARPNSSTINGKAGDLVANMATMKVGAAGKVSAFNFAGQVDLIFDVAGYYVDSINENDLPKVGSVILETADFTIDGGPAELASFTTTTPAAGVLVVTVEGNAWLDYDSAGATSVVDSGVIALCEASATVDAADCGPVLRPFSQDADNDSDTNATDPFSITRVIPVTGGDVTLYLNVEDESPGAFGMDGPPFVTVTWMPDTGALSVVEEPAGP